ncbi:MAG TPA: sulfatase-like hydrolase/transferase [Prolixibacteraceae bacterium]|nr:sulfatase-like hydrolase/transferase [Prolixibacteraceae bacterium]
MRITSIVLLFVAVATGCQLKSKNTNTIPVKPNILFFFADDQRADALGCAGNPYIQTPHIDKLAKSGVHFRNTYVMGGHHGAICAPSRAMLMSGKSLFHVYDVLDGVTTMPAHFSEYGYTTFGTGKWHNGKNSFEATFQNGTNVFLGGMSDHFNVPARDLGEDGKLSEPTLKRFSTDLFAGAAIDFLSDYAASKTENPFFCYVSFTAPHDPRSPQEDYIGMYEDEAMPLPGNFKPLHPFKFDNMNIRDETLAPWPRTPEMIRKSLADYYGLITHIDDKVGEIIALLKEKGLYDNTIIVYAADNGLAVGSHGLLGKQNLYEHSTRVPLILAGPGISAKGVKKDALTYLFDIFPSLCEICNIPIPEGVDGKSFLPVISGNTEGVRSSLYTAYRNTVRAVRTNEWKLITYPRRGFTQLFNLKSDPLELKNLAEYPEYEQKVSEMKGLLQEWYVQTDDTATMNPEKTLPLEYDYTKLKQTPDRHQPQYVLDRYFPEVE